MGLMEKGLSFEETQYNLVRLRIPSKASDFV